MFILNEIVDFQVFPLGGNPEGKGGLYGSY
jgi:hypothetical protein